MLPTYCSYTNYYPIDAVYKSRVIVLSFYGFGLHARFSDRRMSEVHPLLALVFGRGGLCIVRPLFCLQPVVDSAPYHVSRFTLWVTSGRGGGLFLAPSGPQVTCM